MTLDPALASPAELAAALREPGLPTFALAGDPRFEGAWAPLVAVERSAALRSLSLDGLDRIVRRRTRRGGTARTGVAAVFPYGTGASCLAFEVDASFAWDAGEAAVVAVDAAAQGRARDRLRRARPTAPGSFGASGSLRTSLPRGRYEAAVDVVREHIARGDLYQANLTQRFEVAFDGDPLGLWSALLRSEPAPRAAYVEAAGVVLASISPETFVDVDAEGRAVTRPIKGTRPRAADPVADAALAAELLESAKDRAELVMIVDLERNDLGRVCVTGSVSVPELIGLRSYPAVHHLVARVEGRLLPEVGPAALVGAVFPGGSITGAPKLRAIEILGALEPVPRGWYTGSLFWFGDDRSVGSSILIRSVVLDRGAAMIGAGGGVTADSDPRGEWEEANTKARPLLRALGREPEEAS